MSLFALLSKLGYLVVGLGGALLVALYWFQDKLLYLPGIPSGYKRPEDNPRGYRSPGEHKVPFEDITLTTPDGLKLHAWLLKQEKNHDIAPTLLFFHANAGNMGFRIPNAVDLWSSLGCNVLLLSYRGYGNSEGTPSEAGLKIDAQTALDYVLARPDLDKEQLFVFGRSLGGAVALHLAHENQSKLRGVIVENTFASISDMVDVVFPFLAWFKPFILRIKWESIHRIRDLAIPVLLLSGAKDEIVPASQMQLLYASATRSSLRDIFVVENGTHNDTWRMGGQEYYRRIRLFVDKVLNRVTPNVVRRRFGSLDETPLQESTSIPAPVDGDAQVSEEAKKRR